MTIATSLFTQWPKYLERMDMYLFISEIILNKTWHVKSLNCILCFNLICALEGNWRLISLGFNKINNSSRNSKKLNNY